jgi:hypothetical protein
VPPSSASSVLVRRIVDRRVLHLIKMWLDCPVEETDVLQHPALSRVGSAVGMIYSLRRRDRGSESHFSIKFSPFKNFLYAAMA